MRRLKFSVLLAKNQSLLTSAPTILRQRAWLLLEDYFEKLSLSRKDFPTTDWWPRLLATQGAGRLEEMAFLFLRSKRSLPTELAAHADLDRFAKAEQASRCGRWTRWGRRWRGARLPVCQHV